MVLCRLSSEPLIFLYTIIFTINYSCLPQLVLEKVCLQAHQNNRTLCKNVQNISDDLQKQASNWWFYLLTCSLVPSVFTVLMWGPITDRIGRKKAMMFVPFVNGLRAIIYLINSYYLDSSPKYLLIGSFLSCFYGEFQGVVALCYAFMADLTSDILQDRTMRMAFIEACVFGAGIPAGLVSGYLLEKIGYVSVFILTFSINVLIFLYVVCFLPASSNDVNAQSNLISTSKTQDRDVQENKINTKLYNPFYQFRQVYLVITDPLRRKIVLPLIIAFGFSVCAVLGELIVQTLYLKNKPFVFNYEQIGYYSAIQSGIRGFGVIVITQLSFHIFKFSDYSLIIIGLLSQCLCYVLIGLARSTLTVLVYNIAGIGVPVATTTLRSLVTKQVSEKSYGAVLASIEATDAIAGVLTNSVSLWTYNLTLSVYSGVVYFALAFLALISLLLVALTLCLNRGNSVNIVET